MTRRLIVTTRKQPGRGGRFVLNVNSTGPV